MPAFSTLDVDWFCDVLGNGVSDEVVSASDGVRLVVFSPRVVTVAAMQTLAGRAGVAQVSLEATEDGDVRVCVRHTADATLTQENSEVRDAQLAKKFMAETTPSAEIKSAVEECGRAMCRSLPTNTHCVMKLGTTDARFVLQTTLVRGARVALGDLKYVDVVMQQRGGKLTVGSRVARSGAVLCISATVPTATRKRARDEAAPRKRARAE